ncbi:hypothetical protein Tco_0723617 [Tanacetum coccineum]
MEKRSVVIHGVGYLLAIMTSITNGALFHGLPRLARQPRHTSGYSRFGSLNRIYLSEPCFSLKKSCCSSLQFRKWSVGNLGVKQLHIELVSFKNLRIGERGCIRLLKFAFTNVGIHTFGM